MKTKTIILIIIITALFNFSVYAEISNNIDFKDAYTYKSKDLYEKNLALVNENLDILELEILGYSYDNQPIYVIRFGENLRDPNINVNKQHLLIEAGTHSREVANPTLVSKILEDYVNDYRNDFALPKVNVKEIMGKNVMHIIPNSNPDGYNIAKFGIDGLISESARNSLSKIEDKKYYNYKANSRGIDLNRNYPDVYYNIKTGKWVDIWNVFKVKNKSKVPNGAYYYGEFAGSEIETQIMMTYLLRYDFRSYVSYHSKGEVIYVGSWMLPQKAINIAYEFADLANKVSGYYVVSPENNSDFYLDSGYMDHFIENNTLKPIITIETIPYSIKLPYISIDNLKKAYSEIYSIPYEFMKKNNDYGYYKYRLYIDNKYVRDFEDLVYAQAFAKKTDGLIVEAEGKPAMYLFKNRVLE